MSKYESLSLTGTESSLVRPTIATNNIQIKPTIIEMLQQFVQFDKLQDEGTNAHIAIFLEVCNTFKINEAINDAIKLRPFPISLRN